MRLGAILDIFLDKVSYIEVRLKGFVSNYIIENHQKVVRNGLDNP